MINVLYCGDINTRKGIALSIISLTEHVSAPLRIFIMTMGRDIPEKKISRTFNIEKAFAPGEERTLRSVVPIDTGFASYMDGLVRKTNPGSSVELIDATPLFDTCIPEANMDTRFTPCCMLRLYADLVVPALPDRMLYLDYDVLCRKDFTDYYMSEMGDYEFFATLDYYGKWFYSRPGNRYVNSGVMLMNLARMRETGFFASCRELCRTRRLFLPDQHAINRCRTKRKVVSHIYNSQKKVCADTVFHHFSTTLRFIPPGMQSIKPWEKEKLHDVLHIHEYDPLLDRLEAVVSDLNL